VAAVTSIRASAPSTLPIASIIALRVVLPDVKGRTPRSAYTQSLPVTFPSVE